MFKRIALNDLQQWKEDEYRKPLVIRGARQVGKSTLVRLFAKSFDHYFELNVEKPEIQRLFQEHTDVEVFLQALYFRYNRSEPKGSILLFIDEIQESPEAIRLLRYFYEDVQSIHVIAAGSLLDFSLSDVRSFPVGRVSYYYLHPLNFEEFLDWKGEAAALEMLRKIPAPDFAHQKFMSLFHEYTMVGGMPEIVARYVENGTLLGFDHLYDDLWQAYIDDVEKYTTTRNQKVILRHVIRTAPLEQDRITFAGFGRSNYRSRDVGEALRNLELARVLQLVYPTVRTQPPIVSDLKKRPRLQFIDTGLLNHSLQIHPQFIGLDDLHSFYRGFILQHILTQELIAKHTHTNYKANFWVREKSNANAEVDLVFNFQGEVIPIEIKSGKQGRLRSLHQFVERSSHKIAVRFLRNTFSVEQGQTVGGTSYQLINIPYYAMSQLKEYLLKIQNRIK